ncbi:MAG: glycosyltransferase [Candidatus Acidiferrales bacterium]
MASLDSSDESPAERPPRILTYYRKNNHPEWLRKVDLYEPLAAETERLWRKNISLSYRLWREALWTWRLFWLSKKYDVILTCSDRIALFFGVAQRIFRRRRVPHIFLNFFIYQRGGRFGWALRRSICRLAIDGASYALVHRTMEIDAYSRILDVPAQKFRFVPDHATVFNAEVDVRDDRYIFSGGDANRDYPFLIDAIKDLPYRVIIVTFQKNHFKDVEIPKNIEIMAPVPKHRFLELMAHSSLIVVPLKNRLLHVGGRQTYLDAMTIGKPIIVTDLDAGDYVTSGVTGILIPRGDAGALRESIKKVMDDRDFARSLGRKAKEASLGFTPEKFFATVFDLCSRCAAEPLQTETER